MDLETTRKFYLTLPCDWDNGNTIKYSNSTIAHFSCIHDDDADSDPLDFTVYLMENNNDPNYFYSVMWI